MKYLSKFLMRKMRLDLYFSKISWRLKNKHNKTLPVNLFDHDLIKIGNMSYGPLTIHTSGASGERLEIGNYVSIASGVKFILGGNHNTKTFTTFPHKYMTWHEGDEANSKGPIVVQDEVWIGTDAMILSGVTLGKGSVIAAGSVITKSVPAFAIVGGNPARVIRYRFNDEIISRLQKIDFNNISWENLRSHSELFYKELDLNLLNEIEKIINSK